MWLCSQQGPCVATSTGTNRHICVPSTACTGGQGASTAVLGAVAWLSTGHSSHLAELRARPKSARLHFSDLSEALINVSHMRGLAAVVM